MPAVGPRLGSVLFSGSGYCSYRTRSFHARPLLPLASDLTTQQDKCTRTRALHLSFGRLAAVAVVCSGHQAFLKADSFHCSPKSPLRGKTWAVSSDWAPPRRTQCVMSQVT